jgi:hypothetical protein
VIGFSGNVNVNGTTAISAVSVGSLSLGACGGIGMQTICLDATGNATTTSLLFVLSNADTSTGITTRNVHVAGTFCGSSPTCFASTTPGATVPEPATLGLPGNRPGRSSWSGSSSFHLLDRVELQYEERSPRGVRDRLTFGAGFHGLDKRSMRLKVTLSCYRPFRPRRLHPREPHSSIQFAVHQRE